MEDKSIFNDLETLYTDRLILRKMTHEDAEDIFRYLSDPEVIRYSIGEPHKDLDNSIAYIDSVLTAYENNYAGLWCIVPKDTNRVIGTCGIEIWFKEHQRAEIGYSLSQDNWGNGYMTEALHAIVQFGFEKMDLNRIEAFCHVDNAPSLRVLEKIGLRQEGMLRQHTFSRDQFFDVFVYGILREEYVNKTYLAM